LINIHPSLLPAFKGTNVHRHVLEAGVRITGCTVHFVVPELDSGPIIAQAAVPVLASDTEDDIAVRTLAAEHRLYPTALKLLAEGRVTLKAGCAEFSPVPAATGTLFSPSV
jgi:phosphoribosylglycinamide formyltransferase-1